MPHGSAATPPDGVESERSRAPLAPRGGGWVASLPRLQALLGVVPVGLFVLVHVGWKAHDLHGPPPLGGNEGLGASLLARAAAGTLLGALGLHVVLGLVLWMRSRKDKSPRPFSERWMKIVQRVAALGALGLVALHLQTVVLPWMSGRLWPSDVRPVLIATLSSTSWGVPLQALGTILGLACVVVHLGQGLWATAVSWGRGPSARARRLTAAGSALLAVAAFALGANVTVELATGSALTWPWQSAATDAGDAVPGHCPGSPGAAAASSNRSLAPNASVLPASGASAMAAPGASATPAPSASPSG